MQRPFLRVAPSERGVHAPNRRHAKCLSGTCFAVYLVGGTSSLKDAVVMKFLIGVALGILGMWAYRGGKVQSLVSSPPEPMQQAYNTIAERITHVVNNDQIRQTASTVQDKVQQAHAPEIVGRPSEPLPRYDPESVQPENT